MLCGVRRFPITLLVFALGVVPFVAVPVFGDGVGIALRKSDAELLARVNKAIAEIRQNGQFKKIQDKYFDFEIFPK